MTPRRTSPAEEVVPLRITIVTMDSHLGAAAREAAAALRRDHAGIELAIHSADDWAACPQALERCHADIARADILIAAMLFLEEHVRLVLPALTARREQCDALIGLLSAPEVMRLTRLGRFSMAGEAKGLIGLLKRLRGARKGPHASGAGQMKLLRELPKILRFIPGPAQDLRAYFLCLQYWLAGSAENIANMLRLLISRYAAGPRASLAGRLQADPPRHYPEVGLFHPALPGRITERLRDLPRRGSRGRVGVLLLRSYVLAGNA
ncbi:MAG: DUF3479 domain-containing protein, partial [Rhodovarius sp.]|nr:DUF3479 domain-containing protein [Rhodovarius sp.]